MTLLKAQAVHLGLLGVAGVLALGVWTRDEDAQLASAGPKEVEVWPGNPEAVTALSFESPTRKLRLEPKKDALGRWYVGTVDKDETSPAIPASSSTADAGADAGATPPVAKHSTVRFVGIKTADELVRGLAPLHALRAVGKIEGTRNEEFGLDKPEGTLKLTIGDKQQTLLIGGTTPGGNEHYAKTGTGEVYAISGDIVENLTFAESRLPERALQSFKPEDATRVRLTKAGKTRELVRIPDKVEGWADSATPTKLDETAGNWMTKLGRVSVQDWQEKPSAPLTADKSVVRIEYFAGSKPLGSLELFRVAGEKGTEYLAHSEYGRWHSRVVTSSAEQVDQDVASVVK